MGVAKFRNVRDGEQHNIGSAFVMYELTAENTIAAKGWWRAPSPPRCPEGKRRARQKEPRQYRRVLVAMPIDQKSAQSQHRSRDRFDSIE